jgi:hypothetical protein
MRFLPDNYVALGIIYNSISNTYADKHNENRVLEYYNKTIQLFQQARDDERIEMCDFFNNIGIIYRQTEEILGGVKHV